MRQQKKQEARSTHIAAHVWQLGGVNAANVPVEQLGHWVKGVLPLCHSQVTIENTLWHRYLQHNTLHLKYNPSSSVYIQIHTTHLFRNNTIINLLDPAYWLTDKSFSSTGNLFAYPS